jgi:hypothetical protein
VVAAVLVVSGLIFRPERRSDAVRAAAPRSAAPVTFKNVAVSPLPGPAPAANGPAAMESAPAPAPSTAGVTLVLEFDQDSWTEVTADGQRIFSGLIHAGTKRQFDAKEGFRLTFGNAGAVRVTLDGRALEPLGGSGQVVRNVALPGPRLTQS